MHSECQGCGAKIRERRPTICKCQPTIGTGTPAPRPKRESKQIELPCIHRGDLIGVADCGCSGKPKVHWCKLLKGHCTARSTGKPWTQIVTDDGKIDRVGKLKCLTCEKRNYQEPTAKKLLSKFIPQWHYITVDELARDIQDMIPELPPISGVASVPVSGGGAWQIASALHVPFYEASVQYGLRPSGHGLRGRTRKIDTSLPILILDDTVSAGYAMRTLKEKLGPGNYLFASVYAKQSGMHEVDFYGAQFEEPHLLEWNIANTGYIPSLSPEARGGGAGIAFDMDGVICKDPPREFNERDVRDRQAYLEWISKAKIGPIVPRMYEVPLIVSYRCEYTREATEAWLAKHGVKYKELRLWQDSVSARTFDGKWKADAYAERNYGLFIESDHDQAKAIAKMTGKKVLCPDTRKVY